MAEKVLQMIADLTEIFDEEYGMRHLITPENTAQKLIDKGYRKLSADVVEVVRCKDCKKHGRVDCIVNRKMACGDHETTTKANDFCSFGERKDDNHEASDGN